VGFFVLITAEITQFTLTTCFVNALFQNKSYLKDDVLPVVSIIGKYIHLI